MVESYARVWLLTRCCLVLALCVNQRVKVSEREESWWRVNRGASRLVLTVTPYQFAGLIDVAGIGLVAI